MNLAVIILISGVSQIHAATLTPVEASFPWEVGMDKRINIVRPELASVAVTKLPRAVEVQPGKSGGWKITLPENTPSIIRMHVSDTFSGKASGHIFAQVRQDQSILWRRDVGELGTEAVVLKIPPVSQPGEHPVFLEGYVNRLVSNYAVEIAFWNIEVSTDDGQTFLSLLPLGQSISNSPLPEVTAPTAEPRNIPGWLTESRALQPWGATQTELIRNAEKWAPILKNRFGFNTLVLAIPDGHRGMVRDQGELVLSEQEFEKALTLFRNFGFRIIFYASTGHCGHSANWHEDFGDPSTKLPALHPDWLQTNSEGAAINRYGGRWLCPMTGALDYQIDYFKKSVQQWNPDGLMLDNHGFHYTSSTDLITSYSLGAAKAYSSFASARLGRDVTSVPLRDDADYPFWLAWRNFAMADVTEKFRSGMRKAKNDIIVSANVAFDYRYPALGNDWVARHLDAVVTENKTIAPADLVVKAAFGSTLSGGGIPQWAYLGTFDKKNVNLLRETAWIRDQFAAGIASEVLPWVVFYGFTEDSQNAASLDEIAIQMNFWAKMQEKQPWGEVLGSVVSVVSSRQRTFCGGSAIPSHIVRLAASGRPSRLILASDLPSAKLDTSVPLLLGGISSLTQAEVDAIIRFAKAGGLVIATHDSGWNDYFGRLQATNRLVTESSEKIQIVPDTESLIQSAILASAPILNINRSLSWSTAYKKNDTFWMHFALAAPADERTVLTLPAKASLKDAAWFFPGESIPVEPVEGMPGQIKVPAGKTNFILFFKSE